ncbi:MAG: 2-aminoethylphosphonate--pyruvate transaminase [Sarcina sp.]
MENLIPNNDYILLTPGPLSTSKRVRAVLLKDWCTWDTEYNLIVQDIRRKLVDLAGGKKENYTTVLMQGSGSFSVESVIGTTVSKTDKLLILVNGAYGQRISKIAEVLNLNYKEISFAEDAIVDINILREELATDSEITHVAVVHCETTTGILNPIENIARLVKSFNKTLIIDAMSSFGGIPIDVEKLDVDYLISSANKCIQGVPGFGFVIAKKENLKNLKGQAKSLSLDLYQQWKTMEDEGGKWRFTSPTHVVHAFHEALKELEDEGGIEARYNRYNSMQKYLVKGMESLGFEVYVKELFHSPIITTFCYPENFSFEFKEFYNFLKYKGFVIYPGKLSDAKTFRIGNIGDINLQDIEKLLIAIAQYKVNFYVD